MAHTFLVLKQTGRPDRIVVWDTVDISLGRSPENDVQVDDPEVSRRHALFSRAGGSWAVQDLNSSRGTYVNGEQVAKQFLAAKDSIRISEIELVFHQQDAHPASLGLKMEFASQLKGFGGPQLGGANAGATVLGLSDTLTGEPEEDDQFEIGPAAQFQYDLDTLGNELDETPMPRDLDLEFASDDLELEQPPVAEPEKADPAERLRALQKLHSESLITDEEYEAKRSQILSEM